MRIFLLALLLIPIFVQCQTTLIPDDFDEFDIPTEKTITFTHDQVYDMAEKIMETMDKSIVSRDFSELLSLHDSNLEFEICRLEGRGLDGLKSYLEEDELLKKVKKSKHFIIFHPQNGGVEILDVHGFRFDYVKYFFTEENHLVTSSGTLIVRTQFGKIEIVRAVEFCPEEIF
ncbi:unnamed protein product [Caenorhabditis nigoni]